MEIFCQKNVNFTHFCAPGWSKPVASYYIRVILAAKKHTRISSLFYAPLIGSEERIVHISHSASLGSYVVYGCPQVGGSWLKLGICDLLRAFWKSVCLIQFEKIARRCDYTYNFYLECYISILIGLANSCKNIKLR